ncbi:g3763 [Coccomyxa viridis]|uniref:G3763 protein n=1 Tax=Coccomyxa viridis TaxID=1274662 RepID=A0ABP1FSK0_9CHLO
MTILRASIPGRVLSGRLASTSAPCRPVHAQERRRTLAPRSQRGPRCPRAESEQKGHLAGDENEYEPELPSQINLPDGWEEPAEEKTAVQKFLYPDEDELTSDFAMPIWDHLEELRERVLVGALAAGIAVLTCFAFSKDLVVFLEAPVASQGVRFLQLSPGEFFFTTLKVAGYAGLLLATPTVLYEIVAYVVPGLTKSEKDLLAPIVFGSSILFYIGLLFSYEVLTPAALNFFVTYADGAVESLWSIDQYFEFVLVLMLSTGLSFQVPIIQILLGNTGIVSSEQMLKQWRFVVVGATVAAAVLTPSTDPFTQTLLAVPLIGLYLGGAAVVRVFEQRKLAQGA